MTVLKMIGFFKETHRFPNNNSRPLPSIAEQLNRSEAIVDSKITDYLRSGHEVMYLGSRRYLKEKGDLTKIDRPGFLLTDGVWVWPSELPYFIESYNVMVPPQFVIHAAANNWSVPAKVDVTELELRGDW